MKNEFKWDGSLKLMALYYFFRLLISVLSLSSSEWKFSKEMGENGLGEDASRRKLHVHRKNL